MFNFLTDLSSHSTGTAQTVVFSDISDVDFFFSSHQWSAPLLAYRGDWVDWVHWECVLPVSGRRRSLDFPAEVGAIPYGIPGYLDTSTLVPLRVQVDMDGRTIF